MGRTRKRLDMIAQSERKNAVRINEFAEAEARKEHLQERLAYIECYTTAKPGRENEREAIIARYRQELDLDRE